jgi:hypothetical protein
MFPASSIGIDVPEDRTNQTSGDNSPVQRRSDVEDGETAHK